jgi:hypothetical protein
MFGKWFFVPRSWEYGVPWALGSVLSFVLGLFGLPTLRTFEAILPDETVVWLITIVSLFTWNGLVLWIHMRTQFLTLGTAWRQYVGTYLTLNVVFILIFGLVSMARGEVRFTAREASFHDTTSAALLALFSIAVSWSLSATQFLKTEEPGVNSVRLKRTSSLETLNTLVHGNRKLKNEEMDTLTQTLDKLSTGAVDLTDSLPEFADRQLARTWADAAKTLHRLLNGLSPNDFRDVRPTIEPDLRENIRQLKRTC